ncbi:MAG TPA: transglycosylase SLT domain-containing protein [Alphaproteobacteria bacterium]
MAVWGYGNTGRRSGESTRGTRVLPAALVLGLLASSLNAGAGLAADDRSIAARPAPAVVREHEVGLPAVLSAADATAYRKIFALQSRAAWREADQLIAGLKDRRLLGHVLADRYLHPHTRPSYAELARWLAQYADHPDAGAIYVLAQRRAPKDAKPLPGPAGRPMGRYWATPDDLGPPLKPPMAPGRRLDGEARGRAEALKRQVQRLMRRGRLDSAERLVHGPEGARLLSEGEIDYFKAQIAAGRFAQGDDRAALALARAAAARSGNVVPRANWIAGLSLFKQGNYAEAARYFEALARTPDGEPWDIAAGAFWASRAHARGRRFERVNEWLELAAEHPRTFYGLLAIRQLGVPTPFNWEPPPLTTHDVETLQRSAYGARALALIQIGETERAEAELSRLFVSAGPDQMRPLLAVAMRANMSGLATWLGRELVDLDEQRYDGALYPIPPWIPPGGFQVDRALVYAFIRQESNFNARAISPAGARGLMQIMPQTAAVLEGRAFRGRDALLDPIYNISLGQRYIVQLLRHESVQGDLIRLAAAYNGGAGNLMRWTRNLDQGDGPEEDALLFIESLPSPETRHFITRVLYSYWMYSERLGQPTPSLDAVAAGEWPTYIALETEARGQRRNAQTR